MLDAALAFEPELQRARGKVRVTAKLRDGNTVLDRLYQSGSAKARIPKGDGFEVVLLNTAGGITGGDLFENAINAAADTSVTVTTQTAERIYRSTGDEARVANALTIGSGARLDWLPQETILFDRARLRRTLNVHMAEDASFLAIEPLVLGRAAMGETVSRGFLSDHWRVRCGGCLVYADALRLDGNIALTTQARASLNGATACASLLYVAADAEDRIDFVRAALADDGSASAWNGLLAARLVAADGARLRAALIRVVTILRTGPLPRVWFT
ncbi:UNVERIFIED_CONTAM: hypothetical protein GTU68_025707 [Idotea baltica]|nr:hypothetical protein [Idotea baltica]